MAKSKEQKKQIVKDLKDKLGQAKSVVFASFDRLSVKESNELRQNLKNADSEYYVAKKTLLDLVLKEKEGQDVPTADFQGQVAAVFGYADEVAPAKTVDEFRKGHEDKITFLGGILEDKFLGAEEIERFAKLPSQQELYAKLVGSLNAPASGLVNVMSGNIRQFVRVLQAIAEKDN